MGIWKRYLELVSKLLDKGANIEVTNFLGATPLIYAVCNNDYDLTKLLIERSADVNAESYYSFYVLHYAILMMLT